MAFDPIRGVPTFRPVKAIDLKEAFSKGWRDFRAFPLYGLLFAGFYVLANGVDHLCNAYHLLVGPCSHRFSIVWPFCSCGALRDQPTTEKRAKDERSKRVWRRFATKAAPVAVHLLHHRFHIPVLVLHRPHDFRTVSWLVADDQHSQQP